MEHDPKQDEAIAACCDTKRRVVGVTGPAGTGKTTIIRRAYDALTNAGYTCKIGTPTGKSAKRVQEATGLPAMTFHRLLEFTSPGEPDPKTGKPRWVSVPQRDRNKPLECDVVIGDEYAMVNQETHGDIVAAIRPGARLLTFGDVNQLAPIESDPALAKQPSKFTEILTKFNGIVLDRIYRTGEGSGIAENGRRVLRGMAPVRQDDFTITYTPTPVDAIMKLVREDREVFRSPDNQIITPTNITWVGQYKLNIAVQSLMQPSGKGWFALDRHEWDAKKPVNVCVGDKVVITKNLYSINTNDGSMGVFNGETGIVRRIDFKTGDIEIDFGDRIAVFPPVMKVQIGERFQTIYPHREIALAYVLTTHKCQGSEYGHVVYVMNRSQSMQLNRHNLYTGITRARKHVTLITDMFSMTRACTNTTTGYG